jgi:hypothetical protein
MKTANATGNEVLQFISSGAKNKATTYLAIDQVLFFSLT